MSINAVDEKKRLDSEKSGRDYSFILKIFKWLLIFTTLFFIFLFKSSRFVMSEKKYHIVNDYELSNSLIVVIVLALIVMYKVFDYLNENI